MTFTRSNALTPIENFDLNPKQLKQQTIRTTMNYFKMDQHKQLSYATIEITNCVSDEICLKEIVSNIRLDQFCIILQSVSCLIILQISSIYCSFQSNLNTRLDQLCIILSSHIWFLSYLIIVQISSYILNLIMFLFMIVCCSCLHNHKSKLFMKYTQHRTSWGRLQLSN